MTRLQQPRFTYSPLAPSEEQRVRRLFHDRQRRNDRLELASNCCFVATIAAVACAVSGVPFWIAAGLAGSLALAGFVLRMISVDGDDSGTGVHSLMELEPASTTELGRLVDRAEKDYEITVAWKDLTRNGRQLVRRDVQALDAYANRLQAWREQNAVESRVRQMLGPAE